MHHCKQVCAVWSKAQCLQAGCLHSFWQYPDILEPYDDHEGLIEGMEGAEVLLHPDGESDVSDEEAEDLRREREDVQDLEVCEGAEAAPGMPPEVGVVAEACEAVVRPSQRCTSRPWVRRQRWRSRREPRRRSTLWNIQKHWPSFPQTCWGRQKQTH